MLTMESQQQVAVNVDAGNANSQTVTSNNATSISSSAAISSAPSIQNPYYMAVYPSNMNYYVPQAPYINGTAASTYQQAVPMWNNQTAGYVNPTANSAAHVAHTQYYPSAGYNMYGNMYGTYSPYANALSAQTVPAYPSAMPYSPQTAPVAPAEFSQGTNGTQGGNEGVSGGGAEQTAAAYNGDSSEALSAAMQQLNVKDNTEASFSTSQTHTMSTSPNSSTALHSTGGYVRPPGAVAKSHLNNNNNNNAFPAYVPTSHLSSGHTPSNFNSSATLYPNASPIVDGCGRVFSGLESAGPHGPVDMAECEQQSRAQNSRRPNHYSPHQASMYPSGMSREFPHSPDLSSLYSGGYTASPTPHQTATPFNPNPYLTPYNNFGFIQSRLPAHVANPVTGTSSTIHPQDQQEAAFYQQLRTRFNRPEFLMQLQNVQVARFFVMKSFCELDVLRSIRHGAWCSTERGNDHLNRAYLEMQSKGGRVFLCFSVNASGKFYGVCEMISPLDSKKQCGFWADSRWRGEIKVCWLYVKYVPNGEFRHIRLETNENKPVTHCRDCTEILPMEKGLQVVRIIAAYQDNASILDDYQHVESSESGMGVHMS